jgi:hypothetical protein
LVVGFQETASLRVGEVAGVACEPPRHHPFSAGPPATLRTALSALSWLSVSLGTPAPELGSGVRFRRRSGVWSSTIGTKKLDAKIINLARKRLDQATARLEEFDKRNKNYDPNIRCALVRCFSEASRHVAWTLQQEKKEKKN